MWWASYLPDSLFQHGLSRLNQMVNELNAIYNELTGAISDCSIVTKPEVECVSGNCAAVTID